MKPQSRAFTPERHRFGGYETSVFGRGSFDEMRENIMDEGTIRLSKIKDLLQILLNQVSVP